jgi:hypothetical protein
MWEPQPLATLRACTGIALPNLYYYYHLKKFVYRTSSRLVFERCSVQILSFSLVSSVLRDIYGGTTQSSQTYMVGQLSPPRHIRWDNSLLPDIYGGTTQSSQTYVVGQLSPPRHIWWDNSLLPDIYGGTTQSSQTYIVGQLTPPRHIWWDNSVLPDIYGGTTQSSQTYMVGQHFE